MHTIGIIGGMSWYSTAAYYRVVNETVQQRLGGHSSARIALQSLDFAQVRALQQTGDWAAAGRLLAGAGRRCEAGGADFVLIATNLMHKVADDVEAALEVPLLRITDALLERARRDGLRRVALLGARWVMEEDFYLGRLRAAGLDVVVPDAAARAMVDRVIFAELTQGRLEASSRAAYAGVLDDLADRGAQAVILGCTEIEQLIAPGDSPLPLLDSMRVHAEAAVDRALAVAVPRDAGRLDDAGADGVQAPRAASSPVTSASR